MGQNCCNGMERTVAMACMRRSQSNTRVDAMVGRKRWCCTHKNMTVGMYVLRASSGDSLVSSLSSKVLLKLPRYSGLAHNLDKANWRYAQGTCGHMHLSMTYFYTVLCKLVHSICLAPSCISTILLLGPTSDMLHMLPCLPPLPPPPSPLAFMGRSTVVACPTQTKLSAGRPEASASRWTSMMCHTQCHIATSHRCFHAE